MPHDFSPSMGLHLPSHIAEEIESARSIEKRDFTRIKVEAKLGEAGVLGAFLKEANMGSALGKIGLDVLLRENDLGILYYQPEETIDDTPIGIVKGLGAPRGVYLGLAEALAKRGRPVFLYKSPRIQPLVEQIQPEHLRDPLIFQMQAVHAVIKALHNSERVAELRDGNAVDTVDLGGHSMGDYIMVGMAHHDTVEKPYEDVKIRTMTSIAGAGLDGEGGWRQLAQHAKQLWPGIAVEEVWKGIPLIVKAAPRDIKWDAIQHVFRSLPRMMRESGKIVWSPSVEERVMDLDIPFGAILPEDDQFFNWLKVLKEGGHLFGDNYDVIPNAKHVYPNTHPEEFAPHLIAMSSVLAKSRDAGSQQSVQSIR